MTTTLAPKRWPVNTQVIDSPACFMPEYATYDRHLWLVSGATLLASAPTLDAIMERATIWANERTRIVRVPVIPYYQHKNAGDERPAARPVGTSAVPGGTWHGTCGATLWVHDADRRYQTSYRVLYALDNTIRYMQTGTQGYNVNTLQAWWINGVSDRHPTLDGFPIECQDKARHLGPCTALDRAWNWRHYAPWTDQGHNTQLSLF